MGHWNKRRPASAVSLPKFLAARLRAETQGLRDHEIAAKLGQLDFCDLVGFGSVHFKQISKGKHNDQTVTDQMSPATAKFVVKLWD